MFDMIVNAHNEVGEGTVWCDRTARLFWTDIYGATLWAHHPGSGSTCVWPMPERLASIALTHDDTRLLLGLASRLAFFDIPAEQFTTICTVEQGMTTRLNDGRCDRAGNFVFGTINEAEPREAIASYYRLNAADLSLEMLPLGRCAISNSICFSPCGTTMYYCDSPDRVIRRCDYPSLENARVFARCEGDGDPDGSCIDADGFLWNAQWGGARIVRYAPDGSIAAVHATPARQPSCVAIGGTRLDVLYASSARLELTAPRDADGALLAMPITGTRGLPESRFGSPAEKI